MSDYDKEAAEAMAKQAADTIGHGMREKCLQTILYGLPADPLRAKLGQEAIKAIMEGKAAVVPLGTTTEQKRDVWGSDDLPVFNWTDSKEFWRRMIEAGRLDKPSEEPV